MSTAAVDDTTDLPAAGEPAEGDVAPAETEPTEPDHTPITGDPPAEPAADAPAEPEAPAAPDIPEETLKTAAEKYAADKWKQANQTMAAARRAEARVQAVKTQNVELSTNLKAHTDFVERLQQGDAGALRLIGFKGMREFIDAVANRGEPKAKTPEELADELVEKKLRERDSKMELAQAERVIAEKQAELFGDLKQDRKRWKYAATTTGNGRVWEAVVAYHEKHGSVPDAALPLLADSVEMDLRREFDGEEDSATRPAAKNGAPAPAKGTQTLKNKGSGGAPTTRELPTDEEARRAAVIAEMRAAGELGPG